MLLYTCKAKKKLHIYGGTTAPIGLLVGSATANILPICKGYLLNQLQNLMDHNLDPNKWRNNLIHRQDRLLQCQTH